jgi:hypothetical protein
MDFDSSNQLAGGSAKQSAAVPLYPIWTVWFGHLLLANSLNSVTSWKS